MFKQDWKKIGRPSSRGCLHAGVDLSGNIAMAIIVDDLPSKKNENATANSWEREPRGLKGRIT